MSYSPVEESLIEKCRNGDPQAYHQLVEILSSRCYSYFYRLTGNTDLSDDLLSDLFVKLIQKIHLFKEGSFEKWLFTIASNLFKDHLRREYRKKRAYDDIAANEQTDIAESLKCDNQMSDKPQDVLGKLDPETAELITMRFYSELSFQELADMRGEPIGTTLSKVHRGLRKLRELMGKDNENF